MNPSRVTLGYEAHRLAHSFYPVGDGLHVIPVTVELQPLHYPLQVTDYNIAGPRFRRFWLPSWGVDAGYLILGSFLWVDVDSLTQTSPKERRLLAMRSWRATRALGFPLPSMPAGARRSADLQLRAEKAWKVGAL